MSLSTDPDPTLAFLSTGSHPFIQRAWRTFPVLRKDVRAAGRIVLGQALRSSRHLRDSQTEVVFRDGRRVRVSGWRELEYVTTLACAVRGFYGRADAGLVDTLLKERSDVMEDLRTRYEMEKRPVGAVGGGPGAKEILLYLLVLRYKPDVIVETGVAQGVSSRYILRAMSKVDAGTLLSIDLPPHDPSGYKYADGRLDPTFVPEELGVGWLVPRELRGRWELRLGRSSDELPKIRGSVDVFFHDSEHSYETMMLEYTWARAHLSSSGFLASDDLSWSKAWKDFHAGEGRDFRVLVEGNIGLSRRTGAAPSGGAPQNLPPKLKDRPGGAP